MPEKQCTRCHLSKAQHSAAARLERLDLVRAGELAHDALLDARQLQQCGRRLAGDCPLLLLVVRRRAAHLGLDLLHDALLELHRRLRGHEPALHQHQPRVRILNKNQPSNLSAHDGWNVSF
jgi:hypothetical protein